jgi:hypothetical protein
MPQSGASACQRVVLGHSLRSHALAAPAAASCLSMKDLLLPPPQAQQSIDEKERLAGSAATALSEVQAQKGPLEEKVRNERSTFDHHKEVRPLLDVLARYALDAAGCPECSIIPPLVHTR